MDCSKFNAGQIHFIYLAGKLLKQAGTWPYTHVQCLHENYIFADQQRLNALFMVNPSLHSSDFWTSDKNI
jgi:hypothetical protein